MRGKNPTLRQKKVMQQNGMNPRDWLVIKVFNDRIECQHRYHPGVRRVAYYDAVVV